MARLKVWLRRSGCDVVVWLSVRWCDFGVEVSIRCVHFPACVHREEGGLGVSCMLIHAGLDHVQIHTGGSVKHRFGQHGESLTGLPCTHFNRSRTNTE